MFRPFHAALCLFAFAFLVGPGAHSARAQRQLEVLDRGVIAMRTNATQVYVGWRLLGTEDPNLGFNVYRSIGGASATKINGATPITSSTNFVDSPGSTALASALTYTVVPVVNGIEQAAGKPYTLPANTPNGRQFESITFPTAFPNPASTYSYEVKFCWVGDFDGDGSYDFLVDRLSTAPTAERQYLEAYKRDGTFLWRMDMGVNSVNQYAYEPGSSAISVGDTDNVTVYDLDGDGKAEVIVRTANGVSVTNAAGQVVATVSSGNDSTQFVSIIDGLTGLEKARTTLPNPWSQYGTLTNKCAIGFFDGQRPSVLFFGYNRADNAGAFYRVFTAFDFRDGQLTQRWTLPQTFAGAEGHQIRIADVDNDGRDEVIDIGHVIDDDGTQLFVVPEITHGDRFHVADIDPDRPGLENYIIQQNNPSFLATALYDAGTGQMIKKWYATDVVDVGRGIAADLNSTQKGYEMYSTQPGIYNAKGTQIYTNNVWAPEGLWWDSDLLREFIDGAGSGALNPVINKFNQSSGVTDRVWTLYSDSGAFSLRQAFGGRPAFWGDISGDWREELVLATSDDTGLRIYSTVNVATNRLYTLMHNPAYRMQATTKGYVQNSNVDYYLGGGMTTPPPPPVVPADLVWSGGSGLSTWHAGSTAAWKNPATSASTVFTDGKSVRFDLAGSNVSSTVLSGTVLPARVAVYSPKDYVFDGTAGSLAGSMPLVKAGPGSLRVTGSHSFTGATTVWDGALRIDGTLTGSPVTVWGGAWGGPLARGLSGGRLAGSGTLSQPVSIQYRGTLTPGAGMGSAGTLTFGSGLSAGDGATLAFDLSDNPAGPSNDRIAITGNLALSGTVSLLINPLSGRLAAGTYTLATYTGSLTGSTANLAVIVPEGTPHTVSLASGALTLTVPFTRETGAVTWTGTTSGAWDLVNTQNWSLAGSPAVFVAGDSVTFDSTGAARPTVTLNANAPVGGLTFSGSTNYTVNGSGSIGGSGGLAKSGSGTVTLNTTHSFTGPVSVTGGVLAVNNLNDGGEPSSIGASPGIAANFTISGGTLRLVGPQTNTNRGITFGAAGATFDVPVSSTTLQISGGLVGPGSLTKTGSGSLILATSNSFSGGTIVQSGTLILASDAANSSGPGSGGVTLQGGTLRMYDNTGSYNTVSWPINVPAGAAARLETDGRCTFASALTGSGTLDFNTAFIRTDLTGNWSAFSGIINVTTDSDGGDFRINNSNGYANASINFANKVYAYALNGSTSIGALSGSSGAVLSGTAWTVGAKNLDSTFAGTITGNSLTKVGTGTLTLTGASTYTGATTVSGGKLVLAGGSLSGSNVTVQAAGAFGGPGAVTGNVSFASGSSLLANPAAGPLVITGNLALSGTVTVSPVPGSSFVAGTYPLLTYSGSLSGTPVFAWSGAGFNGTFNTSVSGQVSVTLTDAALPPSNVVATAGDSGATLTWSAPATATSSYSVLRSSVSGGPYTTVASGLASLTFTDSGLTNGRTYYYVVAAVAPGGASANSDQVSVSVGGSAPNLLLRFDETSGATANDSSGNGRHASLLNNPPRPVGRLNNGISFAPASLQHASLPSGVVSSVNDFTLSLWLRVNTLATWARAFDFGTGTTNYMFLAPRNSTANRMRFAIRTSSVAEQTISSASITTPTGVWTHVAVTLSGSTGTLYLDGVVAGTNSAMTLTPASLGVTTANYLGRSQFAADPYLDGAIDEFQIFPRAFTSAEIASLAAPPAAPASLTATAGVSQVSLSWAAVPGASAYAVKRAASAAGPYATVAGSVATTSHLDSGLTPGTAYHYVVTALRSVAESAHSPAASAIPASPATPVEQWRITHFGFPAATGDAADAADPDFDGLPNLLEYALNASPLAPSPTSFPQASVSSDRLRLSFVRVADPALVYTVQATSSLSSSWSDIWSSTGGENQPGPVTVPDTVPFAESPIRFLRLRVGVGSP